MILKNTKNPTYIHRIIPLILLLVFTFTSSFVYAQDTQENNQINAQNTEEINYDLKQESNLTPLIIPSEGDTTNYIDYFEDTSSLPVSMAPLVQSLNMTAASTDTLYQENNYDSFYEHSVFVGDSLSVGFQNFCIQQSDSITSESTYFLAKESGSAKAAISSKALTTYANIMPEYQGKVQYIEDSISQMTDIQKVFICYGMNDLVSSTPEQFVQNMETLINRILAKNPDVSIYVLSIPCVMADVQTELLSNSSIQSANALLATTCTEKQWGFINTAEYLMNTNLAINEKYSSDGYVHENNSAYRVWTKVLRNYAYESSCSY